MKKIVFGLFIALLALSLTSCNIPPRENSNLLKGKTDVIGIGTIKQVEYDGHMFIVVFNSYGNSICHHPDCPCLQQYKK